MDEFEEIISEFDDNNDGILVDGASPGTQYVVLNEEEKRWWNNVRDAYMSDNHFVNVSDLQDLDRILSMELIIWRYSKWVALAEDYNGETINEQQLNKDIRDFNKEIRALKESIGVDKKSRDKEKGESIADYIESLRHRAKEFGVTRNKQAIEAITLMQEIQSVVQLYYNCDDYEREQNGWTAEELLRWIAEDAMPRFQKIDKQFRETNQKLWIRDM